MKSLVERQHASTRVSEVEDRACSAFFVVRDTATDTVGPMYAKLDGEWHRFYLDAGLLFWRQGIAPDEEDDLLDGDEYFDLFDFLRLDGARIETVKMDKGLLTIRFETGAHVEVFCRMPEDRARFRRLESGPALA
ncbi:MAG: hypothetical protein AAF658_09810 [Myxococcota bacterium]